MKVTTVLKRYYRWRFSGPITVLGCFAIGILAWYGITSNIEFYDKFTCPQMMEYKGGDYGVLGEPKYKDLNEDQMKKFDNEYEKCLNQGWAPK